LSPCTRVDVDKLILDSRLDLAVRGSMQNAEYTRTQTQVPTQVQIQI